jgi:hypothetical protein
MPANTLQELFSQLDHCLAVPNGATGSELTVVFSLRRDGSLLGRPRISFAKLPGPAADQRAFAEGIASAFDRCLPALITNGLGGAIAGRPLSMRFVVRARETSAWTALTSVFLFDEHPGDIVTLVYHQGVGCLAQGAARA